MVAYGKNIDLEKAQQEVTENLYNGKAFNKFKELVESQNGKIESIKTTNKVISIKSKKSGYIKKIDALNLGECARIIGAGRLNKEDKIDYEVGIILNKKVGDYVEQNEELLKIFVNEKTISEEKIYKCFEISEDKQEYKQLIKEIMI